MDTMSQLAPLRAAVLPRQRWIRRLVLGGLLAAAVAAVAVAVLYLRRPKRLDCEAASRSEPYNVVVTICQEEYEHTHVPAIGARLADALRRSGNRAAATNLATELLATDARSDAYWVLGSIAADEGRMDHATSLLGEARSLHRAEHRRAQFARDDLGLANIDTMGKRLAEALYSLDECLTEARAAGDGSVEGLCHITAARVLNYAGYFDGADQELDRAALLLMQDRDQAWLWFERGNHLQEQARGQDHSSHGKQAIADFERALGFATRVRAAKLVLSIELNLAFSYAELGDIAKAELHHATATALDRDKDYESNLAQVAAYIAYRRGDLKRASSMNAALYSKMEPGDDRMELCTIQTRIALALDDLAGAEQWARRGIDEVGQIQGSQTAMELRPWVLASRRGPYELLFVALARANRLEEAIRVFDQWQGHTLLDAMARPGRAASGLAAMAGNIESLRRLLPSASNVPLMSTGDRGVAEAIRSIDLLALAVAENQVWRITAHAGRLQIEKLGAYAAMTDQLGRFEATPTDRALADALGERLISADLFRERSTLYVVLDTAFASLPVAALRSGGRPLIAVRPVLRLPRLPARDDATCAPPTPAGGATVLADADGSLPTARRESEEIAPLLRTTPRVGDAATSAALFAAKSDAVLHVAVHAGFDTGGGVLQLHDRPVSALEISVNRVGPALVALSGCNTARSNDPELAGSLSTAFLASGSSRVIATLRPITDRGAVDVMGRFYREQGTADPVHTLAAIQASLADTNNVDWPNFAVFGKEVCAH
jgi:tetratricopeptide (TPR) repeat protein